MSRGSIKHRTLNDGVRFPLKRIFSAIRDQSQVRRTACGSGYRHAEIRVICESEYCVIESRRVQRQKKDSRLAVLQGLLQALRPRTAIARPWTIAGVQALRTLWAQGNSIEELPDGDIVASYWPTATAIRISRKTEASPASSVHPRWLANKRRPCCGTAMP
jgi:hypothetical protein